MTGLSKKTTGDIKEFLDPAKSLWLYLGFTFALIMGCSVFSVRPQSDNPETGGKFKMTVSPQNNPVPMPIEVATEIAQLAQGKKPSPQADTVLTPDQESSPRTIASDSNEGASALSESSGSGTSEKKNIPINSKSYPKTGGKTISYKVNNGDTLMKISFETFGDVYRWREIYNLNQDKIKNYNALVPGSVLKIEGVEYVVIERNGQPYLIKRKDTLVKISKWLYGTTAEWKSLWYNNKQLIHDPNKIYAGFTMYYKSKRSK